MLWVLLLWPLCCLLYYLEALKNALPGRRWALGGLLLGPMLWPMLSIEVRLRRLRALGLEAVCWRLD